MLNIMNVTFKLNEFIDEKYTYGSVRPLQIS